MDWENIKNTVGDWLATNGLSILGAIFVLLVGLLVVKLVLKIIKKVLLKTKIEHAAQGFIRSVLKFVLYIFLILIVLSSLGISITGFVVVLSAASLALSLALESSLSNVANGFIIITTKIFKEGDFVNVAGSEGTVKTIKMLYTVLSTPDNKIITIPNSKILGGEVVNYSAQKTRRLELKLEVAYNTDVEKAKAIIKKVVDSNGLVLSDPAPFITLYSLNASSITISCRVWCDTEDYWTLNWYLLDNIFNEFKRENISIPFNQMEVFVKNKQDETVFRKEGLPQRVEKVRKETKSGDFLDQIERKLFALGKKSKKKPLTKEQEKEKKELEKQYTKAEKELAKKEEKEKEFVVPETLDEIKDKPKEEKQAIAGASTNANDYRSDSDK